MSIDGIMLAAIRKDLSGQITGGRIDKIYQPEEDLITITLRKGNKNLLLLISANPRYPRIHLTEQGFSNPVKPPDFCMLLRKYLLRAIITGVEQPEFERILKLQLRLNENNYNLMVEIMGKYSNIILVNPAGTVLDAIKRITGSHSRERQLYPGIAYKYPPKQDKLNPLLVNKDDFFRKIPTAFDQPAAQAILNHFRGIGPLLAKEIIARANFSPEVSYAQLTEYEQEQIWESFQTLFKLVKQENFQPALAIEPQGDIKSIAAFPLSSSKGEKDRILPFIDTGSLFDYYFQHKIYQNMLNSSKRPLLKTIQGYLQKNRQQQLKEKEKKSKASNAEQYKRIGELITFNIYRLEKRAKQVAVIDYSDPEQKTITISLDPRLTPAENAQKQFKKYNKARKSITHIKKQLLRLRHEERYLEQVYHDLEQSENKQELAEIKAELIAEGYIREKKRGKGKKEAPLPPLKFQSSEGFAILVGRNNRQNDHLIKNIAAKNDLWLHIKDLAGSHVIIRNNSAQAIPGKTLEEASVIAAFFSKGKNAKNVPIDYTQVKNVRKQKGAKPGLVYYENYQTIYANPDPETVEKLRE